MQYDDNHIREFEGAKGVCEVCGLVVTLDRQDTPAHPLDDIWIVKCPHCGNSIRCYQPTTKGE